MAWGYTGTAVGYTDSGLLTNGTYITYDSRTSTATATNSYLDQIANTRYYNYTEGTGDDYFNREYFSIPFLTPVPPSPPVAPSQPRPTPEEIMAQERTRNEQEKLRKQEIDAQEKARKLLLEYLDQDNKQKYLEKKPIEVFSRLFNDIRYQIPISKFDKICALKDGKVVSKLCLVVKEPEKIPLEDVILTKFLYILNDEECVLKTANHSSISENLLTRLN